MKSVLDAAHREVQVSRHAVSRMGEIDEMTYEHDSRLRKIVMENCAKICEEVANSDDYDKGTYWASKAAETIRERA